MASVRDAKVRLFEDDQIIIIADKFPKSRHHFLVLPKLERLNSLKDLKDSDLTLVEHMIAQSKQFAESHITPKTKNPVRYGFHMIPSMNHLHIHIISQDFDSPCLKHKKHWNSFTTEFFMDAEKVLNMLKTDGKIVVETAKGEKLLKEDLHCHVCKMSLANIPKLKDHIKTHDKDIFDK